MTFDSGSRDDDKEYLAWAKQVKARDRYTCDICGRHGVPIHSHHKNGWDVFPEQRYNLQNGVTLCVKDHDKFHELYGCGGNTEQQYSEFKIIMETFKKVARKKIEESRSEEVKSKINGGNK